MKIIAAQADGTILGVHMVGPHSTDMIMEGVLAVKQRMTVEQLVTAIHPHPSVTEAVTEAAMLAQRGLGIILCRGKRSESRDVSTSETYQMELNKEPCYGYY